MTSANESGAPICRTDIDVRREVVHMCDLVISHNRKIRLSVDDSVMDFYDGKPYMKTEIGTETILPPPGGELLPRIC